MIGFALYFNLEDAYCIRRRTLLSDAIYFLLMHIERFKGDTLLKQRYQLAWYRSYVYVTLVACPAPVQHWPLVTTGDHSLWGRAAVFPAANQRPVQKMKIIFCRSWSGNALCSQYTVTCNSVGSESGCRAAGTGGEGHKAAGQNTRDWFHRVFVTLPL